MGARNVIAVYRQFPHLPYSHRVALVWIAVQSLDTDNRRQRARVYYGGHAALAWAMGTTPQDQDPTPTQLREVRRVMRALVDAGALKVESHAYGQANARYLLNIDAGG